MASPRPHFWENPLSHQLPQAGLGSGHRKELARSSPTMTVDKIQHQNESIAANLGVAFPSTPKRPTPNSAKKRRQMPDLKRAAATPGHNAMMSMIFRDAAISLQGNRLPTCQMSSNTKRFRAPLSQARGLQVDSPCQNGKMILSGMSSPFSVGSCLGESCKSERASSVVRCHQASGGGQHDSTPTPSNSVDRAASSTVTGQSPDADHGDDAMCIGDTLNVISTSLSSQMDEKVSKPIGSGFEMPIAPTPDLVANPEDVKYPILGDWRSLRSGSSAPCLDSNDEDLHSTHGVPLILPFRHPNVEEAPRSRIDTWLSEVVEATISGLSSSPEKGHGSEDLIQNDSPTRSLAPEAVFPIQCGASSSTSKPISQYPPKASSDKENCSPAKCSSSPTPPSRYLQTWIPSRFLQHGPQPIPQCTKASNCTHPLTPQSSFSLPPKRKRPDRFNSSKAAKNPQTPRQNFAIHEDQIIRALAQLSPDVERHRKGKGPKRERCISYWDEDILPSGSHCVPVNVDNHSGTPEKRQPGFGESKQIVMQLTMEKPVVEEVRPESFGFKP